MRQVPKSIVFVAGVAAAVAFTVTCGGPFVGLPDAGAEDDAGAATVCDCPAPAEPPKAVLVDLPCVAQPVDGNGYINYVATLPRTELADADLARVSAVQCERVCAFGECPATEPPCAPIAWRASATSLRFSCGADASAAGELMSAWYSVVHVRIAP